MFLVICAMSTITGEQPSESFEFVDVLVEQDAKFDVRDGMERGQINQIVEAVVELDFFRGHRDVS